MLKVLLVDDEYLPREELRHTVDWDRYGCAITGEAENGAQALAMAEKDPPDIVITDIRMPEMDGLSLINELRRRIDAVYIILSGYSDFDYAVQAVRFGAFDYLLKPIEEDRLDACLQSAAARVSRMREARPEADPEPDKPGNLYVRGAVEYIDAHYRENLRLSAVAKALFISENYLGKLFTRTYGMRFSDYLNQARIAKSLPLLRKPGLHIYEVADMAGFRDQQYYCVVFKKVMGVSPQQFRLEARRDGQG